MNSSNPIIDYSGISVPVGELDITDWEPPIHKYFGPKNPKTGKMEKEPIYSYIEFPRMMYGKPKEGGPIVARIVNTTAEKEDLLAKNWALTPADFGYIGAPSFEQHLKLTGSAAAAESEVVAMVNEEHAELEAKAKELEEKMAAFEKMKAEFEASKPKVGRPAKAKEEEA